MTPPRTLLTVLIAAALLALAGAQAASASDSIFGSDLSYSSNGTGRFDVNYYGNVGWGAGIYNPPFAMTGGGDAGLTLAIYGQDSGTPTATTYGLYGEQPFTAAGGPTLSGDGSAGTPFVLQTDYHAGNYDLNGVCAGDPCLKVTELAQYRADQPSNVFLTYHVANEGSNPVNFRLTLGADTQEGGYEGGIGFLDPGTPRFVGTDNASVGSASSFQEVLSSAWSRWQESLPSQIWRKVQQPLATNGSPSTGLTNTTSSAYTDKAMAVQWDNYTPPNSGLAGGASHDFQIYLHYFDYDALTLSDPGKVRTDTNKAVTVTATATDRTGGPLALDSDDVHYRVTGGPDAPADQTTWLTQAPGGSPNQADITWHWLGDGSRPAANDGLTVWVDLNDDGIQEDNEPDAFALAQWFDGFSIVPSSTTRRIGQTNAFNVRSYNTTSGTQIATLPFKWKVTGANPQVNGGDPDGMTTCSSSCGNAIDLGNTNVGTDTITVWQDFDGIAGYDGYGEKRTTTVTWTSGIALTPSARPTVTQNSPFSVGLVQVNSAGSPVPTKQLYYTVTGANQQDSTHGCLGSASTGGGAVANTACVLTTSAGGTATITMATAALGDDVLTVWQDDDAIAGSGPTSGDHIVSIGRYSIVLSPDQRLTTSADSSNVVTKTAGDPYDLSVTLKKADGSADTTRTLRYYTNSGSIDRVRDTAVTNDGSGVFTIHLPDAGGKSGYDYVNFYADYNDNGQQDSFEPNGYAWVYWYQRAQLADYTDTVVTQPNGLYVDARLQHSDGSAYTGDFTWSVDGGPVTHDTAYDYDYENASFYVPSQTAGTHTIAVSFTDTDGTHTDSMDVLWKPRDALTLTPDHSDASTGYRMHVGATLMRTQNGSTAPAPAGTVLHYSIYGANDDSGKQTVVTDAAGHATISWVGVNDGVDYVTVWPDYNENGVEDDTEYSVEENVQVEFHNRVDIATSFSGAYEGNTESATVSFHDDAYNPLANKPLAWQITGANPESGTASTNGSGDLVITWKGNEPGQDTLVVWQDTNADGQIDPDEQKSNPLYVSWYQRVFASASCCSPKVVGSGPYTVDVYLSDLDGNDQPGAVLHWVATGASPGSGNTAATDSNGHTSFQLDSASGGTDNVTVFLDSNGNGTRDSGEPQDTFSVAWTNTVNLSASKAATLPEGNTQTITAVENPDTPAVLKYQVFGDHPQPVTTYDSVAKIVINGTSHGYDDVVVWADDGDNVREAGEPASWFFQTWTPRIDLTPPAGNRVAGGTASVAVQMLQANGQPDTTAGVTLNYTITGANPHNGSVLTNSQGKATVSYTGDLPGGDTVSVTNGTYTNTTYVYWQAPPVTLSISHNSAASAYQTNTHTVTAHISGVSVPPAGFPIHFSVSGANTVADSIVQSDAAGDAQFTWTGTNDGGDTVHAYADVSGATGNDGYDPSTTADMTWLPLVVLSSTTTDQAIGEPHTETVTFRDNTGAPLADKNVIYQISGANPTAGQLISRPVGAGAGAQIQARTDTNGNANITWTGANSGTDTLDAWGDANNSGTVDPGEPHATKTVTWRVASASSNPGGGTTTPIGTVSQVTPGSANDFDGVATPPAPVVAKAVNVAPVSGRVFVRLPGKKNFIELLDAEQIPVGSIVDVRKGTVALTSAQNLKGGVATAQFYAGQFQIAQKKAAKPITDLLLYGGSFKGCPKVSRKSQAQHSQKKKIRELWGNGKGQFRTKGKYAAAAVRGTKWDVVDYCDGTLVKVAQGLVQVQPNKGKARLVKAPKSLFVPVAGLSSKKKRK